MKVDLEVGREHAYRSGMHRRTIATLSELEKAEWFSRVGVNDVTGAFVLASWEQALKYCRSAGWQELRLEAANQFREHLFERFRAEYVKWNDIVIELKKTTIPLVQRKTQVVVREHNLPKAFEDSVQWDVLHLCMEAEYADFHPPGFYASQAYWYVRGHFPCGWEGNFPEGVLIIY
jgi:hypothetical protein